MKNLLIARKNPLGGSNYIQWVHDRVHRQKKNALIAACGQTGSGKSYTCIRIAELLDSNFSVKNVVFSPAAFMKLINSGKLKIGSCIIIDEAGAAFMNARKWQSEINVLMSYILQTFRHKRFIVFFITPDLGFVDVSARKLFHSLLITHNIDFTNKISYVKPYLLETNPRMGKTYYKYLRVVKNGQVRKVKMLGVRKASDALLKAYEKAKTDFTSSLNLDVGNKFGGDKEEKKLPRKKDVIMYHLNQGKGVNEVAKLVKCTHPYVSNIKKEMEAKKVTSKVALPSKNRQTENGTE